LCDDIKKHKWLPVSCILLFFEMLAICVLCCYNHVEMDRNSERENFNKGRAEGYKAGVKDAQWAINTFDKLENNKTIGK